MNLYKWNSCAMRDYYAGEVIVMSDSVKSARTKVIRAYTKRMKTTYGYNLAAIKEDVKSEPDIMKGGVAFITGGS